METAVWRLGPTQQQYPDSAYNVVLPDMRKAHRDIKPGNCVFAGSRDSAMERCELKLIDFGMAAYCPEGQALTEVVGTLAYAAPEAGHSRGAVCYTHRASLGEVPSSPPRPRHVERRSAAGRRCWLLRAPAALKPRRFRAGAARQSPLAVALFARVAFFASRAAAL